MLGSPAAQPSTAGPRWTPAPLPTPRTSLVGRDEDAAAVTALLQSGTRLVTLTGTGGVGKTRLALQVASRLVAGGSPGVFVDLSPIRDPNLVLSAAARALGVTDTGRGNPVGAVAATVGSRDLLLILDNFEHVMDAAIPISTILDRCPGIRLLVTSRERLSLSGELEYEVAPLGIEAAIALFADRAASAGGGSNLALDERAVTELCHQLDRLPLALELAAARTKVLSPGALGQRVRQGLAVLSGGARDLPDRQRTLSATIAWSYDTLPRHEQAVLETCAVFPIGVDLSTLEHVHRELPRDDVLLAASSLVDKHLLASGEHASAPSFTVLETVRAFVTDRLSGSGRLDDARRAHAEWVAFKVRGAAAGFWWARDHWLMLLEGELDNLRAALTWCFWSGDHDLGAAICSETADYWQVTQFLGEAQRWLTAALDSGGCSVAQTMHIQLRLLYLEDFGSPGSVPMAEIDRIVTELQADGDKLDLAYALEVKAGIAATDPDPQVSVSAARGAVASARRTGSAVTLARALKRYGAILTDAGREPEEARRATQEAIALAESAGAHSYATNLRSILAWDELVRGDCLAAETLARRALAEGLNSFDVPNTRANLGWALLAQSRNAEALREFAEAARAAHELGATYVVCESLIGLARAASVLGNAKAAACVDLARSLVKAHGLELSSYVRQQMLAIPGADAERTATSPQKTLDPREVIDAVLARNEPPAAGTIKAI
jgi:predicted ATPase